MGRPIGVFSVRPVSYLLDTAHVVEEFNGCHSIPAEIYLYPDS